ncbi:MAG: thiamine pyrophosphate-dependent enzyme [archaeon]
MKNLNTNVKPTWCPGCWNFQILAGVKNVLQKQKGDTAIVSGIGCHAKIYDYLNLPGLNSLHGRVLPVCLGLKVGNPNLNVVGFSGDGDAYAEGIAHLVHAARYNSDFKYIVHNNQVFALTVGQPTPVTEKGFIDKTTPLGVKLESLNPVKLMLSVGASFVARVFADVKQVQEVVEEALKHKGFAFIEVIQPCLIFHPDPGYKEKTYMMKDHDKTDLQEAMKKAEEFDYNKVEKIPLGIFYQKERPTFEDLQPSLAKLKKTKKSWRDIKR